MRRWLPGIDAELSAAVKRVAYVYSRCPNPRPDVCGDPFLALDAEVDRACAGTDRRAAVEAIEVWERETVALLKAERDENVEREDFTVSEKVELGRRLEELERPAAEERKGARTDLQPHENSSGGSTRDKVGAAVGMSGVTYQRAKAVVTAAETGLPEAAA